MQDPAFEAERIAIRRRLRAIEREADIELFNTRKRIIMCRLKKLRIRFLLFILQTPDYLKMALVWIFKGHFRNPSE